MVGVVLELHRHFFYLNIDFYSYKYYNLRTKRQ